MDDVCRPFVCTREVVNHPTFVGALGTASALLKSVMGLLFPALALLAKRLYSGTARTISLANPTNDLSTRLASPGV